VCAKDFQALSDVCVDLLGNRELAQMNDEIFVEPTPEEICLSVYLRPTVASNYDGNR
jgi:hypothetical protein